MVLISLIGFVSAQSGSDCCTAHSSTGCDEQSCEDCVCGMDGFCCSATWDSICAGEAQNECAASCACSGDPTTTTTVSSCYAPCGQGYEVPPVSVTVVSVAFAPTSTSLQQFDCDTGCDCDMGNPFSGIFGQFFVVAEGTCEPGIPPAPEFGSLTIMIAALLTAPTVAYVLYRRRH